MFQTPTVSDSSADDQVHGAASLRSNSSLPFKWPSWPRDQTFVLAHVSHQPFRGESCRAVTASRHLTTKRFRSHRHRDPSALLRRVPLNYSVGSALCLFGPLPRIEDFDLQDLSSVHTGLCVRWFDTINFNERNRGVVHSEKSSHTPQKNPKNPKKIRKIRKKSEKSEKNPHTLFGREQLLEFSVWIICYS